MPQIAPRFAGWQRRLGSVAGPLGAVTSGSGESPNGAVLQVELFVGGLWVDITPFVMTRDGGQNVSIRRGRPNEAPGTDPGSCAFQLNNRDGRFSPRNPLSPYYGQLGRNQPLRVSVPSGNDKAYRFWGEVSAWPQSWDATGTDVWVEVQAAGILRRLGQGSAPVGSALRLALTQAGGPDPIIIGAFTIPVVAYWPFEDGARATAIASALDGQRNMTITGTPTLSSSSGFVCSDPLPVMGSAKFTGTVAPYAATASTFVAFLLLVPVAGATDGQRLVSWTATGTITQWEVYYSTATGGSVGLRGYAGASLVVNVAPAGVALNGVSAQVTVQVIQAGADVSAEITSTVIGTTIGLGSSGTAVGQTAGIVSTVTVAADQGLTDTVMGHVRVQAWTSDEVYPGITDVAQALIAYAGETADDRVYRLLLAFGISPEQVGPVEGAVAMGTQLSATLLTLLSDAALADGGILYERTSALGLGYRTRRSLENQDPALTLSYPAFQLAAVPTPLDDDQFTRNDVTASRPSGSSARSVLSSGPLSVLAPPAGVGRYDTSVSVNVESDADLVDQAGWRLHLGTVDEARYPQIAVNLAHPTFVANPGLRRQVLAVRPGDRIVITDPPAWMPPDDITQIVQGFSESVDGFQHRVTFNCAPESPYRTGLLDSPAQGRLDTDGSVLAVDAGAADTALSVATSSGPTWTTNLADSPFDLRVGGEVVTVSAVGTLLNSNPFFADLTGWSASNGSIAADATVVNTAAGGAASVLITPNGASASGGVSGTLTAVGTVTAAASYVVSLWAYSPAGWSDLRPCVDWYDAAGVFLSSGLGSATVVPAATWTYIEQTLVAPASASRVVARGRHGSTPAVTDIWYAWAVRVVPVASMLSASPQTLTVVRSVNGITKAQAAGTDVRLAQPMIIAL